MRWEQLTTADFPAAVEQAQGVCLLPLGVIEPHGGHLPLTADLSAAREVAIRAAAQEPAIIFPWYYFGQVLDAKHKPGTVAIGGELVLRLLDSVCAEIARNGLTKILIVNGHGGNTHFLRFFLKTVLEEQRDFVVYVSNWWQDLEVDGAKRIGHAGEGETSGQLAVNPELVKMDQVPPAKQGQSLDRYAHLPGLSMATSWYADYPHQYAGESSLGTVEQAVAELGRLGARRIGVHTGYMPAPLRVYEKAGFELVHHEGESYWYEMNLEDQ